MIIALTKLHLPSAIRIAGYMLPPLAALERLVRVRLARVRCERTIRDLHCWDDRMLADAVRYRPASGRPSNGGREWSARTGRARVEP